MALSAGTRLGPYEILAPLGAGGMGEVYRARDPDLERDVAIKLLPEGVLVGPERLARFQREAKLLASLNHPGIASIHAIDKHNDQPALVLELVEGKTLEDELRRGAIPVSDALDIARQIAEALEAAHARGIIHRDLKPANIKITPEGRVKLLDFGLAKAVRAGEPVSSDVTTAAPPEGETRSGTVLGTAPYMSPEQARGEDVDRRTDIWAFGCVVYELLTGQRAFPGRTWADAMAAVLHSQPDWEALPATTPPLVQSLLRRCLEKKADRRLRDIADARIEIEEAATSEASGASSPSRPRVASFFGRTKRTGLAVVVALVVTSLIVASYHLVARRGAGPPGIGTSGRPAIAVVPFEDHSGSQELHWLSNGIPSMLLTGLAQTPGLDVVSDQRLHEILEQLSQDQVETIDKALVTDIARRVGAGAVVVGSIFKAGSEIRIDVRVQDVGTGRLLSAQSVVGADVFPMVDELIGGLRDSLELDDRPAGRTTAEVTTSSLPAFRLYSDGIQAQGNVRIEDARRLFERALEIDPGFALARLSLARVLEITGQGALAEEHWQKLAGDAGRLTDRASLSLNAALAAREGEPQRSAAMLERLLARYPDEERAYVNLSRAYRRLGDDDRALATLDRGLEALPHSSSLWSDYGYEMLRKERFADAIRSFQAYATLEPNEPNPHDSLGEAYLVAGQPEEALGHFARAVEVDPLFGSQVSRARALAMMGRFDQAEAEGAAFEEALSTRDGEPPSWLLFYRALPASRVGRYRDAVDRIERGLELAREQETPAFRLLLEGLAALLAIEKGEYSDARRRVNSARSALEEVRVFAGLRAGHSTWEVLLHMLGGVAEARAGDLNAARREFEAQHAIYDEDHPWERWWHGVLAGEIALAADDPAAAEVAFLRGEPVGKMLFRPRTGFFANSLPFRDGRARARKAQGDLDGAIRIYRELLSWGPASMWTAMLEPRFVLELARLLDQTGDTEGARAEYQRFVELWKNADAGLPELEEARGSLEGLNARMAEAHPTDARLVP